MGSSPYQTTKTVEQIRSFWIPRGGVLKRTKWYRTNGPEIASSTFGTRRGVISYFLRQDGSVRMVMHCCYDPESGEHLAHGVTVYYAPDGSTERAEEYRDGVRVGHD